MTRWQLIMALLRGYGVGHKWNYLEGDEDKNARAALAEMLRGGEPLPTVIRRSLADLIDPACESDGLKIEFVKNLKRGRPHNKRFLKILIACHVQSAVDSGATVKEGIRSAADKFHLSQDQVRGIWHETKPLLGVLVGPNTRAV